MSLRRVQRTYEELGRDDPLWAVLSREDMRGNRWDPDEFFATGRREVDAAMEHVASLGLELGRQAALDFGCGVGRLSQALCEHFERVVGVDISSSMLAHAREYNRHGARCEYVHNTTADLALLADASFDFVYSNIALQHSPPESSARYVAEFFRVLRPGGIALFHVPSGRLRPLGALSVGLCRLRTALRRLHKRLRGKPAVEMHCLHRSVVGQIIARSGGRLVEVARFGSTHGSRIGLRYCARRELGPAQTRRAR